MGALSLALLAAGCGNGTGVLPDAGDGGSDATGDGPDSPADAPSDTPLAGDADTADDMGPAPGLEEVTARAVIDERGGLLAVADRDSPLYGAQVLVPLGALAEPTLLSIREGDPLSPGGDGVVRPAMGVGPVLELLPADQVFFTSGQDTFADRVIAWLPLPAGTPATGLGARRWTGTSWLDVATEGGRLDVLPADSETGAGLRALLELTRFGVYQVTYPVVRDVVVHNYRDERLRVSVVAHDYETQAQWGFTPPPLTPERFADHLLDASDGNPLTLTLVPGNYLLEAVADDGVTRYCGGAFVPVAAEPLPVTFFNASPLCAQPDVTLTADAERAAPGGSVTLQATVTAPVNPNAGGAWDWTGGSLNAPGALLWPSGEQRTATWTAPDTPGTYWVMLTGYGDGNQALASVAIEVGVDNEPPVIASLTADRPVVGPGRPVGERTLAAPGDPGVIALEVTASDPDGDPLRALWLHAYPGSFHDVETGIELSVANGGAVLWPDTLEPYAERRVLYQAPPGGVDAVVGEAPPFRLPVAVSVSDGLDVVHAWGMGDVVEAGESPGDDVGPGPDAGGDAEPGPDAPSDALPSEGVAASCVVGASRCFNYVGSSFHENPSSADGSCALWSGAFTVGAACPAIGSLGACTTFAGRLNELQTVHYAGSAADHESECEAIPSFSGGPGIWVAPYVAE